MTLDTTLKYLIQHSESKEYICPSDDSKVITRPLNQSEKARAVNQWTLDRQGTTFSIKNVANSKSITAGPWSYEIGSKGAYSNTLASSASFVWTISQETVNAVLDLKYYGYSLYKTPGKSDLLASSAGYSPESEQASNRSWILVIAPPTLLPMTITLPSQSYRIRAFNGPYLLTMPNNKQNRLGTNVYVEKRRSDLRTAKYQIWEANLDTNTGLYAIKNRGTGFYLTPNTNDAEQGESLVGKSGSYSKWIIQSTESGVMFFIGVTGSGSRALSIGFPDYDGGDLHEVQLQPSDRVPSQIWFFEDANLANPPGQRTQHLEISSLPPGVYYIRSYRDATKYLCVDWSNYQIRISDANAKSGFTLTYRSDDSDDFTLSYVGIDTSGNEETAYVFNGAGFLDLRDPSDKNLAFWIAIPHKNGDEYNWHISNADTREKAISSRPAKRNAVTVDPMVATDQLQWWTFERK